MKKLERSDLLSHREYGIQRDKFTQEVIKEKKTRRFSIDDRFTLLLENRLTVWYQIQEMIRLEQIEDEQYIKRMLEIYNGLIPNANELSMTLMITVPDQESLREFNGTIVGIEKAVQIVFGGNVVTSYEEDAETEEEETYTQSVHYVRFPFSEEQKEAFLHHAGSVEVRVAHANYQAGIEISEALVEQMKKDLA